MPIRRPTFEKLAAEQADLEAYLQTADGHNLDRTFMSLLTRCGCRRGMRR
jgi:hypothetical protein